MKRVVKSRQRESRPQKGQGRAGVLSNYGVDQPGKCVLSAWLLWRANKRTRWFSSDPQCSTASRKMYPPQNNNECRLLMNNPQYEEDVALQTRVVINQESTLQSIILSLQKRKKHERKQHRPTGLQTNHLQGLQSACQNFRGLHLQSSAGSSPAERRTRQRLRRTNDFAAETMTRGRR